MLNALLIGGGTLAAIGFSARWNWWRPKASGVPILMYHKVGEPPAGSQLQKLWVSVEQFRRQMRYLADHGYAPLTFKDVAALQDAGKPFPDNAVIITFDDGYKNNHDLAMPVLKEFGFKAVIYLVVEAIGRDNFWHDPASEVRIPMLTWDEVEKMKAGGFEIGSHTLRHPRLEKLAPEAAREEIFKSREALTAKLGEAPVSFAYPYGNGADRADLQGFCREAGYRAAVSVHQGLGNFNGNAFCLKRIFVRGDDNMLDFHLNMTRGKARF